MFIYKYNLHKKIFIELVLYLHCYYKQIAHLLFTKMCFLIFKTCPLYSEVIVTNTMFFSDRDDRTIVLKKQRRPKGLNVLIHEYPSDVLLLSLNKV